MDPLVRDTLWGAVKLLFFFACIHKLRAFREFQETLAAYRLVPGVLAPIVAAVVVAAEAVVALFGQMVLAGVLLLAYAGAIALNLFRGRDRIDCGCVGVAGRDGLSSWLVGRNLVCAAAAFAASSQARLRELAWLDMFAVLAGVATLVGLYVATDQLIANETAVRRLREAA